MKLYLVRHGIATQRIGGEIANDGERPLTNEGRAETKVVAQGLKRLGVKPDLLLTSPLVRARQTADIFADVVGKGSELQICQALAPGGQASDLYAFLKRFKQADQVLLFGHEPDMGLLAGTLLWVGPDLDIPFKKAGVCRIDISSVPPTLPGTLKWFITPKIAGLMAQD